MTTYNVHEFKFFTKLIGNYDDSCKIHLSDISKSALKTGSLKLILNCSSSKSKEIIKNLSITLSNIKGNINILIGTDNANIFFADEVSGNYNIEMWGKSEVYVGKSTTSNGCQIICNNSTFYCGEDCMFSDNILFQGSDQHGIIDTQNGQIINNFHKKINIGNHVWIERKAIVMPDVKIEDGSIVATGSIVTKNVESNVIVAGIPAEVVKKNRTWSRSLYRLCDYSNEYLNQLSTFDNETSIGETINFFKFKYNENLIQKVAVLANCQGGPIKELLKYNCPNIEFIDIPSAHLINVNDYQIIFNQLKNVDLIISQPLSNNFKEISIASLKEFFSDKLIIIPVVYFRGYNPEIIYLKNRSNASIKGSNYLNHTNGKIFYFKDLPLIDYHDIFILYGFLMNYSIEQVCDWFENKDFPLKDYCDEIWNESINTLKEREKECDIIITDVIEKNSKIKLFRTINHPNNVIIETLVERILKRISFEKEFNKITKEFLANEQFSSYKSVEEKKNFISESTIVINKKHIARIDLIQYYFNLYKLFDREILLYNLEIADPTLKKIISLLNKGKND